ncbi:nesprin-1 isoform X2 [Melanotaenia boesemani]|uniref:nesprin-1 isoform X2 n=1 Tax=Melanotaenia boesemani TaxID=1250792 RepID=UPI001C0507EA|nr:nesprin-1 isoform X2 [Melanotaenia boesemani]
MPGVDSPFSGHLRDTIPQAEDGNVEPGDEVMDTQLLLDLFQHPLLSSSSPLELKGEDKQVDGSWSGDGDVKQCGQLERKWMLWHEFMKEHDQLEAWLQLAEQAMTPLNFTHVTYSAAKEELRKFERLQCEAGRRLVQLDSLTRKNRTLTRLFQGTMQARLLALARENGRRWDDLNTKLESITGRLQLFVLEWEEFEAEREELALWLGNMDVRLMEIEHLTGNTCEKLRQLQSFQQCVCENSSRVNALLQRGEALIQRSESADAQHVESGLLELLRRCSHVYSNIARTHTRLLSMRLVFEDDWILSQATDSGCPSETLQEEDGLFDKQNLDHFKDFRPAFNPTPAFSSEQTSPLHHPPPPPAPSSPVHEHMGLEWDPSVDIGRSVSHDDADSSYFSASTGLGPRDDLKRWSYFSSLDSRSDISNDITNQETDVGPEEWLDHAHPGFFSPVAANQVRAVPCREQWMTSTPDRDAGELMNFDGGRVKAWLRVQSSASPERMTTCSKAVQTDGQVKPYKDGALTNAYNQLHHHCHDNTLQPLPTSLISSSCDLEEKPSFDCVTYRHHQSNLQAEEESSCCEEAERLLSERSRASSPSRLSPAFLCLLLAVAVALLGSLICVVMEPPCHRSNRMSRSLHLALRYVNGPPPT